MLTIHTPIELTVNPSILQINDNFTERLTGNYQVIGNGLEPEDMLHFLSEPPEIYLAEGGMTALIDNKNIVENQNLKLDVINNVLNRILVSDTYRMTYQDQVFIESVLKQMGVSNVQEFIRQVQNIRQESKNVSHLTDLYWSESEMFSRLLEYRQLQAKKEHGGEETEEKEPENVLWLHQEIMNRLQTGVVYQELKNYLSATANHHQVISNAEMQISEQTVTAQNILLNKLKNYTTMEEQPLVYHYINAYEMGDEVSVQEDHSRTMSQMVQAVLLNALHQMYALRRDELLREENVWYQLAGTVYQAAENTFQRFSTYHNQSFLTGRDADVYSKMVQQYQRNEIRAIEQFFTENRDNTIRLTETGVLSGEELAYLQPEETDGEQPETFGDISSGDIVQTIQKTELHGQQIRSLTKEENLLRQQLEQINQNNIQNQQLLQQFHIQEGERAGDGRINREKARKDALRALSEPEEVLMTYMESETVTERQEILDRERLTQIFGADTVRIFETLEKYQKTPELMTASGQVVPDAAGMLLKDIQMQKGLEQDQSGQPELTHMTQELTQETPQAIETRQILREYLPEQVKQIRREAQRQIERVEIVHRQEENTLEEEMLEEIRGLHRTTRVENQQTVEHVQERNTTQEIINSRVNEFQTQQNEEIARMISDRVQRQLGSLSEQVYGKLEKRMETERRRRGL